MLSLAHLDKVYSNGARALDDVSLDVEAGEIVALVGGSGCGKTTLLRLLAGMETATDGAVEFPSDIRRVGMVFQEPRLMPWLTVRQNMAFAIHENRTAAGADELVDRYIGVLGLEQFRDAFPSQLSGGMAQRVSLGRTLCYEPDLILMDEPFGALDYFTRRQLQREMADLFLSQKKTVVLVTHDVSEAVLLGQSILIMDKGRIIRNIAVDLPYRRNPATPEFMTVQQNVLSIFGEGEDVE